MIIIQKTNEFTSWFNNLRDLQAKARITQRIHRLALGNPGQYRVLKKGVAELKLAYGSGYRVYYTQRGNNLVILLCGGDKSSQQTDIKRAYYLASEVQKNGN